jgi:hypothetical protein
MFSHEPSLGICTEQGLGNCCRIPRRSAVLSLPFSTSLTFLGNLQLAELLPGDQHLQCLVQLEPFLRDWCETQPYCSKYSKLSALPFTQFVGPLTPLCYMNDFSRRS